MLSHDILIRPVLTAFAAMLLCSSVTFGQTPFRYMIEELPTLEAHPNCPASRMPLRSTSAAMSHSAPH